MLFLPALIVRFKVFRSISFVAVLSLVVDFTLIHGQIVADVPISQSISPSTTQSLIQPTTQSTTESITKSISESTTTNQQKLEVNEESRDHSLISGGGRVQNTCEAIGNVDHLTQDEFLTILTKNCRYDKLAKPDTGDKPLNVSIQLDIRHIEADQQLKFKLNMLVQYRYMDTRLAYEQFSPKRNIILGEEGVRSKIWIPHIQLYNEKDGSIMGLGGLGKDLLVSISPKGEVFFSYRMTTTIYCWMDLQKFPFDEQTCRLLFKSWTYNSDNLMLQWEDDSEPVKVANQLHLTEFSLRDYSSYALLHPSSLNNGIFVGNYSVLVFKFLLSRQVGYYIMDYFLPSIMLVITSWVTFWLQADNTAPRVTLGTSTMLSFITLASGQSKTLPKVSYIKASEIWFVGCIIFIFASICEFAFVNIIWRRKKKIELKKVNSKYILKSTLTPRLARKELQRSNSMNNLHKSHSCSSLEGVNNGKSSSLGNEKSYNNYLTVHSFPSDFKIPTITMESDDDTASVNSAVNSAFNLNVNSNVNSNVNAIAINSKDVNGKDGKSRGFFKGKNRFTLSKGDTTINMPKLPEEENVNMNVHQSWTTMTPQEIACWIDKRSRIMFPIAFIIFNIFYWSFVYGL